MKNAKKISLFVVGGVFLVYSLYLMKKSFIDKGYPSPEFEKEILLGNYVLTKGLPDNQKNRDLYRYMTLQELKDSLNISDDDNLILELE